MVGSYIDEAILDRGIAYFVPTLSCNLDDFLKDALSFNEHQIVPPKISSPQNVLLEGEHFSRNVPPKLFSSNVPPKMFPLSNSTSTFSGSI